MPILESKLTKIVLALVCVVLVLIVFPVALDFALRGVEKLYAHFPENPSQKYNTFAAISGTLVALLGIFAAIVTFLVNARLARRSQKKQHTITVLLESRLSEEFQKTNTARKAIFPAGKMISFREFSEAQEATHLEPESLECKRRGAQALEILLNHYEFLAVGISEGDLDEVMLKKSLRGIMCRLVSDSREVISEQKKIHPKSLEHLITLYEKWRNIHAGDEKPLPK